MNNKPNISLFFPAYNEEKNIVSSIAEAQKVLSKCANEYEIIAVDDGSSDNTGKIIDRLAAENPRVRAVHHWKNQGYGAALWSGIQAAKYDWVFFTDADLQFDLEELPQLLEYIPEYRAVLGYRAKRRDPFMRLVNAKGWNILNRILFGLKVKDIDCAFKLFDRRLVSSLPLETRGAAMSAEMLIRLDRKGVLFKEVPVTHLPRKMGSPTGAKPAVIIRAFKELYKLYRGELGHEDTTYVQVGKFGIVGVINTLVDIATYFLLTRFTLFFSTHILDAKFVTFFLGTICSFVLNRHYTFKVRSKLTFVEVVKFYSTIAITISTNVGLLYVFNGLLGIYDLIAVGLSTVATFIIGFVISKLWVFRKKVSKPFKETFGGLKLKPRLRSEKIDWGEIARSSNDI
jgi:glycosyltransferase involved in cell wall biosynthesis